MGREVMSIDKGKRTRLNKHSFIFQQTRITVIFTLVIGGVCLAIFIWIFFSFSMRQVLQEGEDRVHQAVDSITSVADPADCVRQVQKVYLRASGDADDPEYYKDYEHILASANYRQIQKMLDSYTGNNIVDDCFIAFSDADEKERLIIAMADVSAEEQREYIGQPLDTFESALRRDVESGSTDASNWFVYVPGEGLIGVSSALLDEDDPSAGSLYFLIDTDDVADGILDVVACFVVLMAIALVLETLLLSRRMNRTLVRPLEAIAGAVQGYSNDREAGVLGARHFAKLDIHTGNEVEHLASTLATMEKDVATYVDDIARISAEQERKATELRMAAQIQQSALPSEFPAFPDRAEFDIHASMSPAREVGGDFYDFFLVDEDHLCMVMADVSDKGVPSALFMMTSKTTLANHIMMGKSPAQALTDTNTALCTNNRAGMFVTIWVGILQISTGVLTAANGGHEYPILQRPHGEYTLYKDRHGLVVGGMSGIKYTDYRVSLRPGAKLFVYTDGVPEATNTEMQMFGLDRTVEALNAVRDATPEETLAAVRRSVDEFVQGAEQFDDLTMLCLEYKGEQAASHA